MAKKDNTRAEWIRGVSHDIRTPLSLVLGYASALEEDCGLPQEARKQAGIIRRESEKIKRLVDDLNLTTKLEYALQPVRRKDVDWVEINRQAVSEILNSDLESRYALAFIEMQPGRSIHLLGDGGLLRRMLDHLIPVSYTHLRPCGSRRGFCGLPPAPACHSPRTPAPRPGARAAPRPRPWPSTVRKLSLIHI